MDVAVVLPARMRHPLRTFSPTPFEQQTRERRAEERYCAVSLAAAAILPAKLLSVAAVVISVPATLRCPGAKRFSGRVDDDFARKAQSVEIE